LGTIRPHSGTYSCTSKRRNWSRYIRRCTKVQ